MPFQPFNRFFFLVFIQLNKFLCNKSLQNLKKLLLLLLFSHSKDSIEFLSSKSQKKGAKKLHRHMLFEQKRIISSWIFQKLFTSAKISPEMNQRELGMKTLPFELLSFILRQLEWKQIRHLALRSLLQSSKEMNAKLKPSVKYANLNALIKV